MYLVVQGQTIVGILKRQAVVECGSRSSDWSGEDKGVVRAAEVWLGVDERMVREC